MRRQKHPEDIVHDAVCDHLRSRGVPNLLWWHTPNASRLGGKRTKSGTPLAAIRNKRMGVLAGVSDILAFHRGRFFALELKPAKGAKPPASQTDFISAVNANGGSASVAFGVDDALAILETWGILQGRAANSNDAKVAGTFVSLGTAAMRAVENLSQDQD